MTHATDPPNRACEDQDVPRHRGIVYLVGAGPGPADLLTLRAVSLLGRADVVVYDRLVMEEVLAFVPPSAKRIFMGKAPGASPYRQADINALLLDYAIRGKTVVRLKGGDPFVFGRGAEEAEFLVAHGIPFEVVPGVSSALAAPLRGLIPVTHRGVSSSVVILTGHACDGGGERLDWDALGRMDTLVFLMGVHDIVRITSTLIDHGKPASTPAAIVQGAYWPGERILTATLGSIAEVVTRAGITPPATLVIGDVVAVRDRLMALPHHDLAMVAP
jgi:uroporphyrin-III C-methyltransferase